MNLHKFREIIKSYKTNFTQINNTELYKWKAFKCFQNNWNINSQNFPEMLDLSLSETKTLLGNPNYFPRRMLRLNAEKSPEEVRKLFIELYDEEKDLIGRILNFRKLFRELNKVNCPNVEGDYQDHRAVLVYLSLKYPDRYYLYKFEMFKIFAHIINFNYVPRKGNIDNVIQFLNLCNILKEEILHDNELLVLNESRITSYEFSDVSSNILTQDIIYYSANNLTDNLFETEVETENLIYSKITLSPQTTTCELKGSFINHIANGKENKKIGDLGELLVLEWEKKKLIRLGISKNPEHISKSKGDGLGYDILSYDENGDEIYIEVKCTKYKANTTFYLTRNEVERSIQNSSQFYLYRLFDYDIIKNNAKFCKIKGSLLHFCLNPILYKVNVT